MEQKATTCILVVCWHNTKAVHMLTTVHEGKMQCTNKTNRLTGEVIKKPDVVKDYNINMRLLWISGTVLPCFSSIILH